MNPTPFRTLILMAGLTLAAACTGQPGNNSADAGPGKNEPETLVARKVAQAMDEARQKLATENIDVGDDNDKNLPKAQISPQGDLLIGGKAVAVTDAQRALLLKHRANVIAIAESGMALGVQGADLGMKAAGEAMKSIFTGNSEEIEKRVKAEADKIEAEAKKLCDKLPPMLESQNALSASLPEFKPYATMDQSDIDDCRDGDNVNINI